MNNKKIIIIVILAILLICAVCFGIYKGTHSEDYLYNQDGTVVDGKSDLINHLKSIENSEERKKQIDYSVQQNIITQEQANELY